MFKDTPLSAAKTHAPLSGQICMGLLRLTAGTILTFAFHWPALIQAMPDPKTGTLPNGLHYIIFPNDPQKPAPCKMTVRIDAGALNEADDEVGAAFFIGQMIGLKKDLSQNNIRLSAHPLNVSLRTITWTLDANPIDLVKILRNKNMPPNVLTKTLQEYIIKAEAQSAYNILSGEFLDDSRAIAAVRKALKNTRQGDNPVPLKDPGKLELFSGDEGFALMRFALAGTLVPKRIPRVKDCSDMELDKLRSYANAWFRPEHVTIVLAGANDQEQALRILDETLGSLAGRAPARPSPDVGVFANPQTPVVYYYDNSENYKVPGGGKPSYDPTVDILLCTIDPAPGQATPEYEHNRKACAVAQQMLGKRFEILTGNNRRWFIYSREAAGVFAMNQIEGSEIPAADWPDTLAMFATEINSALTHGFGEAELGGRRRFSDGSPVTLEECNAAFRKMWGERAPCIFVKGVLEPIPAADILAVYENARAAPARTPDYMNSPAWPYFEFGEPGKVVAKHVDAARQITRVTFENGVCLVVRPPEKNTSPLALPQTPANAASANVAEISVFAGDGRLVEPQDQPGLARMAEAAMLQYGLNKYDVQELRRLCAKAPTADHLRKFQVQPNAFVFGTRTMKDGMMFELQLIAARLTDTAFDEKIYNKQKEKVLALYENASSVDMSEAPLPASVDLPRFLAGGDTRFGLPRKGDVLGRTNAELSAWLAREFARGRLDVCVRTGMEPQVVIEAVARTLGALPARTAGVPVDSELRKVTKLAPGSRQTLKIDRGISGDVYLCWPITDGMDGHRMRVIHKVVASVIAASPDIGSWKNVGFIASETYPGYGYIFVPMANSSQHEIAKVKAIAGKVAEVGVNKSKAQAHPIVRSMTRNVSVSHNYFLDTAGLADSRNFQFLPRPSECEIPVPVADRAAEPASDEEADAYARQYLAPENAIQIITAK